MTDLRADSMTGEQFVFDERTADPSSTQEGERWLRTDLTSGDKIATLRVDVGSSILDVPVFPVGTAEDSVVEAIRVRVGSQTGYIPAVPETNANFPALRLQHNGQVFGYHDEQGVFAFFDVAISSTNSPVEEGSNLNVDYSVVNTGFSANNTQDIRLNIDSTEEDRDTNITLSPSSSTTGTLTWTTPSSSAGTYNASVLSDDDTASTSVTVEAGSAIPDSVVDNYEDADADPSGPYESGQTLNDYYSIPAGSFARNSASPIKDSNSLERTSATNNSRIISQPGDGLPNYPAEGESVSALITDFGQFPFVMSAVPSDSFSGYGLLVGGVDDIRLWRIDSASRTELDTVSTTSIPNEVVEVVIEPPASGQNTVESSVWSVDQTTFERQTQEVTLSGTDSTYAGERGLGIANAISSGTGVFADEIRFGRPI